MSRKAKRWVLTWILVSEVFHPLQHLETNQKLLQDMAMECCSSTEFPVKPKIFSHFSSSGSKCRIFLPARIIVWIASAIFIFVNKLQNHNYSIFIEIRKFQLSWTVLASTPSKHLQFLLRQTIHISQLLLPKKEYFPKKAWPLLHYCGHVSNSQQTQISLKMVKLCIDVQLMETKKFLFLFYLATYSPMPFCTNE